MPDYKKMYYALFNQISKTIEDLQAIQQLTEEMFIDNENADLVVFSKDNTESET